MRYEADPMTVPRPRRNACARVLVRGVALVVALAGATGCRGFTRVQAGGAYNLADRPRQSGQVLSVDAAIATPRIKPLLKDPLPFGVHTSLDLILAPERKALAWGTGLIFYGPPRPISPYAIAGTSFHVDEVRGRLSFGNVSPYGELGVLTSVPARHQDQGSGMMLSLGLAGATYFNYLASARDAVDGFVLLKIGVGWETH